MTTSELRIGNILRVDNDFLPINGIKGDKIYFKDTEWSIENAHEIPLTEELVEKFGFEKCWDSYRGYLSPVYGKQSSRLRISIEEDYFYHQTNLERIELKYVHQLQNMYFVFTGKELGLR